MLSLFLESPTPAARREDVLDFIVGREPALGGCADFGGESVLALPIGFLSEIVVAWVPDFLSEATLLETVGAAIDSLFGAPDAGLDFFSSPEVTNLVFSSTEPIEARGL